MNKIDQEIQESEKKKYEDKVKILQEQDLEKNSKPLWITKQFVEKPILVIIVCGFIFLLSIMLVGVLELFSFSESTNRDYLIWGNERVEKYDSWTQMQQEFQENLQDTQVPERSQEIDLWTTNIMVYCEDCNVLESKYITALYEFEEGLKNLTNFKKLCLASTQSTECAQDSYISFMPLFPDSNGSNLSESEIQNLKNYVLDEANFDTMKYLFGADFTTSNPKTKIMRSIFKFGAPLNIEGKLFKDKFDNFSDQKDYFTEFSKKIIELQEDLDQKYGSDDVKILVFSRRIDNILFQQVVDTDFLWAFASIVFVWIYISCHLHSVFLGSVAMFNILMSFPLTVVIFRLIFQISYFSSLHILAVFVVLGIAADDVFVFMDAWGQTQFYEELKGDLNKRMAVTFRRAAKAMVATSSTTSAAFFATGLSTIMPISSFGYFAGVLVPMNFILVITFFPAVLIVQNKYFKQCCVRKKQIINNEQNKNKQNGQTTTENQEMINTDINKIDQNNNREKINQEPKIEQFLGKQFNQFVYNKRYFILAIFFIWTGIAIWRTSQISPITKPEEFLPDDNMIEIAKNSLRTDFHQSGASDNGIKVYFTWGVKDLDKKDVSMWDPENLGDIVWDEIFDLSPEQNQSELLKLCQNIKKHDLVQDEEVICFMEGFYQWLMQKSEQFPVVQNQFMNQLKLFAKDPAGGLYFYNQNQIGLINGELKYIFIILSAKGTPFTPYDELNPVYEKWEKLESEINQNSPQGLKNMFQSAGFNWVWMISERAFVTNAIQGMTISLAFACVVLLLSTHNIVISFYSIISISGIVVSVVAIMELLGWKLGIAESITIVILIGLSVDFVVHLANHYVESVFPDKFRRMQISLKEIGISILSGAFTTMGAGIFLFFAVVIIFNKFALLIVATIMFSLAYSLLFFSALLHAFGPQKEFGNINFMCKVKKQNKTEKNDDTQKEKEKLVIEEEINTQKQEQNQKENIKNQNNVIAIDISQDNKKEHIPPVQQDI